MEYRILTWGPGQCGKVKLLEMLVKCQFLDFDGSYPQHELCIGSEDAWRKQVQVDGETCVLHFERFSLGQEEIVVPLHVLARHFHCIVCCFSLCNRSSFETVMSMLEKLAAWRKDSSYQSTKSVSSPAKMASMGALSVFPKDVVLFIFRFLCVEDVHRLRRCCKLLRLLIDDRGPKNPMPALKFAFSLPRFCPVVLVGTMCDRAKERAVAASEAEDFSKKHGIPYFETSAFMNVNVENVYFEAVRQGRTMLKEIATEREEKKTTQCSCM